MHAAESVGIIGGGLSGLYTAYKLAGKGRKVIIYETSNRLGGRWKTVAADTTTKKGPENILEAGAWRVACERHQRTMQLMQELKVELVPISLDHESFVRTTEHPRPSCGSNSACDEGSGLSTRDHRRLVCGKTFATLSDQLSGYPGQDRGSCAIREVYGAVQDTNVSEEQQEQQHKETNRYAYPRYGFSAVIEQLQTACQQKGVKFCMGRQVRWSGEKNRLRGWGRVFKSEHKGETHFQFLTEPHTWLVWCVPPHCLPLNQMDSNFHLLRSVVMPAPLVHVYAPLPDVCDNLPTFKIRSDTELCQSIHHRPASGYWQPCYASGEHAQYWYRLYMSDPKVCFKRIRELVTTVLKKAFSGTKQLSDTVLENLIQTVNERDARLFYWDKAIHMWEPVWNSKVDNRKRLALQPNPVKRPNVFVVGEAFSTNQGWAEGCLETAELAIDSINNKHRPARTAPPQPTSTPDCRWMMYRGIPFQIPVTWLERHPGGAQAIENHTVKGREDSIRDITHLWDTVHKNSSKAYQHLFTFISNSN